MATVTVKLFQAGADAPGGHKMPVAILDGMNSAQFTSSGTSQPTTFTAPTLSRNTNVAFARVHSDGGTIRFTAGPGTPVAVEDNTSHPQVASGEYFDVAITPGDKVAIIDSA